MTDSIKTVKHTMTKERFLEIRKRHYCEHHKYIYDFTYGQVSSWLTWNRDEKDKILEVKPPEKIRKGDYYDGPIDNWDQDKISSKITTDIVFIGLNMSGDGKPKPTDKLRFQNARGHKRIVNTFFGTTAEGAYFTDIIKPDRRIDPKKGVKPSNSKQVINFVKANRDMLKDHIRLFEEELKFIGADKPLLIVFGNAEEILRQGIYNKFFTREFHAIVVINHYAYRFKKGKNDIEYKKDTKEKLKPFFILERAKK